MIWLFDYDLTLYGEDERPVLQSLDNRISLFVQKVVGCDFHASHQIRTEYLERFGTTLSGLQAMHQVEPNDFFDFIHETEYLIYPKFSQQKRELLQNLDGPRFVFTNGRSDWSETGMARMGILDCMEGIFGLEQMDWIGKPHESAYEKLENWLKQRLSEKNMEFPRDSRQMVLLDDSIRNLEMAHRRGWTTILVNPQPDKPDWLEYRIAHLLDLPKILPFVNVC